MKITSSRSLGIHTREQADRVRSTQEENSIVDVYYKKLNRNVLVSEFVNVDM